jgi:hypothetical protein
LVLWMIAPHPWLGNAYSDKNRIRPKIPRSARETRPQDNPVSQEGR